MKFFDKLGYALGWLVLLMGIGLVVLFTYWEVYPYKPLVVTKDPMPILTSKTTKAGQSIRLEVDYCKYVNLPTSVSRSFVNSVVYVTPQITTNNPRGCHSIIADVIVPAGLPPDTYHIEQTFRYQINPVRTVEIKADSEDFQIVE